MFLTNFGTIPANRVRNPPTVSGVTTDTLRISWIDDAFVTWIGVLNIAIYTEDFGDPGNEDILYSYLTRHAGTSMVTAFSTLSAGEYGTDSDYNTNDGSWKTSNDLTTGSVHWNDNQNLGLEAFFKFDQERTFKTIYMYLTAIATYGWVQPTFWKEDGTQFIPSIQPANSADYYSQPSGSNRVYKYVF